MTPKKLRRYIFVGFLFGLVLTLSLFACIYFYLPIYLESTLLPELARNAGIQHFTAAIQELNFFSTRIHGIRIGNEDRSPLEIDSIQVDYTPSKLFSYHVDKIVFSGLALTCEYKDNIFRIRGLDLEKLLASFQNQKSPPPSDNPRPSFSIGRVDIHHGLINFIIHNQCISVPVDLQIVPEPGNFHSFTVILELTPRDQIMNLTAKIDIEKHFISIDFHTLGFRPEVFSDIIQTIPGLIVSGVADLKGNVQVELSPFSLTSIHMTSLLTHADIGFGNLRLKTDASPVNTPHSLYISRLSKRDAWDISLDSITVISPLPFQISSLKGSIQKTGDGLLGSSTFSILVEPFNPPSWGPIGLRKAIHLPLSISATYLKDGEFTFQLQNSIKDPKILKGKYIDLTLGNDTIHLKYPDIQISGKGNETQVSAEYHVRIPSLDTQAKGVKVNIGNVLLQGKADIHRASQGQDDTTFTLGIADIKTRTPSTQVHIPNITLKGEIQHPLSSKGKINSRITWGKGSILNKEARIEVSQINGNLPLRWPFEPSVGKGKITVKNIRWKDLNLGSFESRVQQQEKGVRFDGNYSSHLFPGLVAQIKGDWEITPEGESLMDTIFSINPYTLLLDNLPGNILQAGKGVNVHGDLKANGKFHMDRSGLTSTLSIDLANGSVQMEKQGILIKGIQTNLNLTDVLNLKSAPKQHLGFDTASLGKIRIADGKIDYQIESSDSIFIEKISVKWCEGNVDTYAVRLSPGMKTYNAIIYGDRLKLSEILKQILSVDAHGDGTVNGRIPIQWDQKGLHFENGFLYSSPGEGGTIRLTKTDMITAGIPKNTPQYAQLELAREALKDYDYKWVKLNLESQEDLLLIRLQLDGKPSKPLPFEYKKEFGGFAKVEAGSKGSLFEGLQLNVNFRVPFEKMLHMGESFKHVLDRVP